MARSTIDLTGPFFERDPAKTVRQNIREMLGALAAEGERAVKAASPVGPGYEGAPAGSFRAGVVGRVESLTGRPWALHAVISQQFAYPWGTRRGGQRADAQYRGGKLERKYHMFANVRRDISAARAVASANLSKGLE